MTFAVATSSCLANAHAEKRPRFHVYRFAEDRVLWDVRSSQAAFLASEPAFELLSSIESGVPLADCVVALSHKYGNHAIQSALSELETLEAKAGFFTLEGTDEVGTGERFVSALDSHHPRTLMLLIERSCNLACTYCYEVSNDWHRQGERMSQEQARMAVDDLVERSGNRKQISITFFGGEPMLNWKVLVATTEYAREAALQAGKTCAFTVTTNGTIMTEDMARFLVVNQFGVMLSIDGDKESHDRYRRTVSGGGSHDSVVANASRLLRMQRQAGVKPLNLRATLTRENSDAKLVETYLRETFPGARVTVGGTWGVAFADKAEADITAEQTAESASDQDRHVIDLHRKAVRDGGWEDFSKWPLAFRGIFDEVQSSALPSESVPKICGVGRNVRATTPDGKIYPCHRYVGMEAFELGGDESSAEDIRSATNRYYEKVYTSFAKHCHSCWARFRCGGPCAWTLSDNDGEVVGPTDEYCTSIRGGHERAIWLYLALARDTPEFFGELIGQPAGSVGELCASDPELE